MRTLLIAERPCRDLRSRALLQGLPDHLGQGAPLLLSTAAPTAPAGFEALQSEADPAAHGVTRVVIAGAFQERPQLELALAVAARAVQAGAALEIRAFTVERGAAMRDAPKGVELLAQAHPLELRDHHTANALMVWRSPAAFRIRAYPECATAADDALLPLLPPGPILGLSILGGPQMRQAWTARLAELQALLAPMQGWAMLPLPMEHAASPMDDLAGTRDFLGAMLPGATLLLPELAQEVWRRRQLTPGRMRALVARCGAVVTNQDVPAAFAITAGVPVIGLALGTDRRAITCLTQFANTLPAGSQLLHPPRG